MTAIDGATIYTDTYNVIYYNVSGILAGSINGPYTAFPDKNFPGYPICTITSADVGYSPKTLGSNYITDYSLGVGVILYSKSVKDLDQLSNKLISGLSASDKSSNGLCASGLMLFNITSSLLNTQTFGNDRVHSRTFGVTGRAN